MDQLFFGFMRWKTIPEKQGASQKQANYETRFNQDRLSNQLPLTPPSRLTRVVVANMYFSRSWKLSTCSRITLRLRSLWKKSVLLSMVETPWGSFLWTSTVVGGS